MAATAWPACAGRSNGAGSSWRAPAPICATPPPSRPRCLGLKRQQSPGDHHHRRLSAERRLYPVGAQARRQRPDLQCLFRRQRRARCGAGPGGRWRLHHAGRAVSRKATRIPLLAKYRKALVANDSRARPSFGSLEGYIAGRLTADVLARAGDPPTPRELPLDAHQYGHVRYRRLHLELWAGRQPGFRPGVPHRDPGRRIVPAERLDP